MTRDHALLREKLWGLLGDLPERQRPVSAVLESDEERPGYVLERLTLDLNGIEPVPAFFCRSKLADGPAPLIIYNHAHGGAYDIGKAEAVEHRSALQEPPYADVAASMGYHLLAIDAWNFGERRGRTESSLFKQMLWNGQVLWGMMVYDTIKATDYAVSHPDVDPSRIASMGISMGSTMAWWHAALDERVRLCIDICCLTDYQSLIDTNGLDFHGIYYYVPSLLKEFDAASINALIAPRAHLSLAGNYDGLTPQPGLDKIDAALKQAYTEAGASDNWKLLRYPCGHLETAAMRAAILDWLRSRF